MAQNALNDSINHFKITNQHINLAHDLLNSDDYLVNEKKLCNLVDSHSPLLIFEAFNHPKMSNNRLKLLARNVGITMISELVDELDDSKMVCLSSYHLYCLTIDSILNCSFATDERRVDKFK